MIKQSKSLDDTERQKLFSWGENIFGVADFQLSWRQKELHFLLYINDKVVSHVGVIEHIISVDRLTLKIGGIGGVTTVKEEQRKGYASLLMKHTSRFLRDRWTVDFGLLFCIPRMIPFYEMLGWKLTKQQYLIEQPAGKIISPLPLMVLPCANLRWPDHDIDLQSRPW